MRKNNDHNLDALQLDIETIYSKLRSELSPTRNIDDLKQRILAIVKKMGFSDYIFIRMERQWMESSNYGLLYSISQEFMRVYHEEKMYSSDLMIPYAKANTQPIFSSHIYNYLDNAPFEIELTKKNRALNQLHKRFGFYDQFFIPMKASNGSGNVQLTILHEGITSEDFQTQVTPVIAQLRCLCKAIDSVSTTRFRESFIEKQDNTIILSPKQLAVFTMLANNDLTISETAKLMCISPITAHQHIASVRKALGVSTNIAAIRKLVKLGLIDYH